MLNLAEIKSHILTTALQNLPIDLYTQIDSTNTELKRLLSEETLALPRICLAEQQTMGKGRTLRNWHSPFGLNIYLSCAFSFSHPLHLLEGFSLVTAIATAKALSSPSILNDTQHVQVKWPNDVFFKNKKLAGILVETITQNIQQTYVVVGIGINVNMRDTIEGNISQPWTSLSLISGKSEDRNAVVATLIEQFFLDLNIFEGAGLMPFLDQWEQYDFLKGKEVTLQNTQTTHRGIAAGINTRGQLLIKTPDEISTHSSGQVTWER